jgi:hypothetical protein
MYKEKCEEEKDKIIEEKDKIIEEKDKIIEEKNEDYEKKAIKVITLDNFNNGNYDKTEYSKFPIFSSINFVLGSQLINYVLEKIDNIIGEEDIVAINDNEYIKGLRYSIGRGDWFRENSGNVLLILKDVPQPYISNLSFKQISNNDYENKNYDTKLYEIFPNDFDTFKKYKMQIYNTIGYSGIVKINEDNYIIGKYYRFSIDNAFWRNKYSSQEEEKKLFIICNNLIKDAFFFWKLEAST